MHFSEDDLRNALRRQDPGPHFTQRVMTGINRAGTNAAVRTEHGNFLSRFFPLTLRPAMAGALAVLMFLASLGYLQHRENERKKQHEQALAKEAEREAIIALRITNAKLKRVFQRVREQENDFQTGRERPRRERL
jgi:hypothetical protein